MKYEPKKVFILENGNYTEITYAQLQQRRIEVEGYNDRKFIPLHGVLMEVTEEDFIAFYKTERRRRYVDEWAAKKGAFLYEDYMSEGTASENILMDRSMDAQEQIEQKEFVKEIRRAFANLSQEEFLLIKMHYCKNISEPKLAKMYGVSQQAISKRLKKIKAKLKKFLKI